MSRYSHLPIYIEAQNLLKEFHVRVPKFHKQYKYSLGSTLIEHSTAIVAKIMEINNSRDGEERRALVRQLEKNIDMLFVHLRISYDLKQINSDDSYMFLSGKITEILKQTEGWKKYLLTVGIPRVHSML